MKKQASNKRIWTRPEIHTLSIKKDTFSGSGLGAEQAGKVGTPSKTG